jgi:hypothetical protein
MPDRPDELRPGDAFGYRGADGVQRLGPRSAAWLDAAAARTRAGTPALPGLPGSGLDPGDRRRPVMARLSGSTSPYSWAEVYPDPDAPGWLTHPAGRGGAANAHEVNAVAGLGGRVAELRPGGPGDWRFQHARIVGSVCRTRLTVRVECGSTPVAGTPVTVTLDGDVVATCTTDAFGRCRINLTEPGEHVVSAIGLSRTVVAGCVSQSVAIRGPSCFTCINGGPPTLTLATPYGDVTLVKDFDALAGPNVYRYVGGHVIPDVPNVSAVRPHGEYGGYLCCGDNLATRDLPVLYVLGCNYFGLNFMYLQMLTWGCAVPNDYAGYDWFLASNQPGSEDFGGCAAWGGPGSSSDIIWPEGGACIPCESPLEFAIDYGGVGSGASVVTVTGLGAG